MHHAICMYMLRNSNHSHRKINPIMSQTEKFSILLPSFFLLPTIFDPHPPQNIWSKIYPLTTYFALVSGLWIPTLPHCSFYQNPSHYSKSHFICLVNSELMGWCSGITDVILLSKLNIILAIYHLLYNIKLNVLYYFILLLFIACNMSLILWTSYQFIEFIGCNAFSIALRKVATCTLKFH